MTPTAIIIVLSALLVITDSRDVGLGICYRHELVPKVRMASFYVTNTVIVQQSCGLIKTCEVTQLEYRIRYNNQSYNSWEEQAFCCDGYKQVDRGGGLAEPLECVASCNPTCEHGDCIAPSHCRCHLGYKLQSGSRTVCIPDCPRGCHNGHCAGPEICACDPGYSISPDPGYEHYCVPVCRQSKTYYDAVYQGGRQPYCTNGHCILPDTCLCDQGYNPSHLLADNLPHCKPVCKETCINSDCVAPNQCSCHESYETDKKDMSRCNLITSTTTANPAETTPKINPVSKYCNFSVDYALDELFDNQECFVLCKQMLIKFESQFMSVESIDCLRLMLDLNASMIFRLSLNCTISRSKTADSKVLLSCSIYDCPSLRITNRTRIINALLAVDRITLRIENDLEALDHPLIESSQGNLTDEVEFIHFNKICWCKNQERICVNSSFMLHFCQCDDNDLAAEEKSITVQTDGLLKVIVLAVVATVILIIAAAAISYYLWQRNRRLNDPLKYKEREVQHRFSNPAYILPSLELISDTEDNSE